MAHVKRFAFCHTPQPTGGYTLLERIYKDGQIYPTSSAGRYMNVSQPLPLGDEPPADLQSRHLYTGNFPSFESPGAVDVKDFGAVGDLDTDDTVAIQAAIEAAHTAEGEEVVFLPRGLYKISDTLHLYPNTKLIGCYRQWSVITSSQADGIFGDDGTPRSQINTIAKGRPLIETANSATANTVIANLRVAVGFPITTHNGWWSGGLPNYNQGVDPAESKVEAYAIKWQCGGESIIREIITFPRAEFNFHFNMYNEFTYEGALFQFPLLYITNNGGGRIYGHYFHGYAPFDRDGNLILVENNLNPVHFYHMHAQHNTAENLIRFVNAKYLTVYGMKTEHHHRLLKSVNSEHIRIFGHGGIATPKPGDQHYLFEDTSNFLLSNIGDEVQFGDDWTQGSGWAIMYFTNLENYHYMIDRQSGVDYTTSYPERAVVWLRGDPQAGYGFGAHQTYAVNFTTNGSGSISGNTNQTVGQQATSGRVEAQPAVGYEFTGWSGDYSGTQNPLYIPIVNGNMNIQANFVLTGTAPEVSITNPTDGNSYETGTQVTLTGTAFDPNNGGDISSQIQWTSSIDGNLGSGASINVTPTVGTHIITATVNTSGQDYTDSISLTFISQTPYQGTPATIPGIIECEYYDEGGEGLAYHDDDSDNSGVFRPAEGVDAQTTLDPTGIYNVGWTVAGEWLEYTVNITTAGEYDVSIRTASTYATSAVSLSLDGTPLLSGPVTLPNTGDWQGYVDHPLGTVTLPSGTHVLRLTIESSNCNLNYMTFSLQNANSGYSTWIAGYTSLSGAQTDATADPDTDGINNLIEYAFNTDPDSKNQGMPITVDTDGNNLRIHFNRYASRTDLSYEVQANSTLDSGSWTTIAQSDNGQPFANVSARAKTIVDPNSTDENAISITDNTTLNGSPRFLRVKITSQ